MMSVAIKLKDRETNLIQVLMDGDQMHMFFDRSAGELNTYLAYPGTG